MAIQRNDATGTHFISTTRFQDRSKRRRYEKMPLVDEGNRFFAAIAALFGRGPGPFAASPIAWKIARRQNFLRALRRSDRRLTRQTPIIEAVSEFLRRHVVSAYEQADAELDRLEIYLKQERGWLEQCRPSEIYAAISTELTRIVSSLPTALASSANEAVKAKIKLAQFCHRNDLNEVAWGKHVDFAVFGQLGVLLGVEFIVNSFFQADTQATGLVGGVIVALFTSVATVVIGLFFGWGYQHRSAAAEGGGWIGYGVLALTAVIAFIFISSLSLMRIAGETGDLHPILAAQRQLRANLFAGVDAMLDITALAYTLFVATLILLVARKYLDYAGGFPGYRKRMLEFLAADGQFHDDYHDKVDEANELLGEQITRLDLTPGFIASCKMPIEWLVMDHENVLDQLDHDTNDIRGAARLFDAVIAEHADAADAEPIATLEGEPERLLVVNQERLHARHQDFVRDAAALCAWDDVSPETVDAVKARVHDLAQAKLGELSAAREELLENALREYEREEAWKRDVLKPAA